MVIYDLVRTAIANKQQIHADYNGHSRQMCPHVIGTKGGRVQCLFYQFGGSSNTGLSSVNLADNWRCIPLEGLINARVVDGPWHTAPNHSRPQTCVGEVDLEVAS